MEVKVAEHCFATFLLFLLDEYDCQDYNKITYLGSFFNHSVAIPLYEFELHGGSGRKESIHGCFY